MRTRLNHITLLLLILIAARTSGQSSEWATVNTYRESLKLDADYPYINFFRTIDQKPKETYLYYKTGNRFVLALIEGGVDSVKEKVYPSDVLFHKVDAQLKQLLRLSTRGINREQHMKAMKDPVVPYENIAIRYKRLHYNHYTPAKPGELALIKNEDLVAAYGVLFDIILFFREQIPGRNN